MLTAPPRHEHDSAALAPGLPENVDVIKVAAAMNPAMSAWVALCRRVPMRPGQSVLVLGATGNAGGMAVQVARLLGAGWIVGAGRNPERLAELLALGADDMVTLDADAEITAQGLADAAVEVDIVIDYLWGEPAAKAMMALLKARADRSRVLDWIQIGAIAGPTMELPSVALRSANLRLTHRPFAAPTQAWRNGEEALPMCERYSFSASLVPSLC
jgi:NADPH:quinone reductase-like Zn-dependent oxidoreductase